MSVERAHVAIESLIADQVAISFKRTNQSGSSESTAAQIRSRITDHFQHDKLGSEQDNAPPALLALRKRLVAAFAPPQVVDASQNRAELLDNLQTALAELRHRRTAALPQAPEQPLHVDLLLERQQLLLKNEFTEGFGRVEIGLVSVAVLALVLLRAIDFLWAIPILALGIGRSWHLDRACKKRLARIAEIDAVVEPSASRAHA